MHKTEFGLCGCVSLCIMGLKHLYATERRAECASMRSHSDIEAKMCIIIACVTSNTTETEEPYVQLASRTSAGMNIKRSS